VLQSRNAPGHEGQQGQPCDERRRHDRARADEQVRIVDEEAKQAGEIAEAGND